MDSSIAYTFSPLLRQLTHAIDQCRLHILATPLLPRKELTIRSATTHKRILTVLQVARIPMTPAELTRLLQKPPKRPHPMEQEALLYRQAVSYIRDEWTGELAPLTLSHIEILMHISLRHSFPRISRIIQENSADLLQLLAYIEASDDHPILLAGITHAFMTRTPLHAFSRGRITSLLTDVIMARTGYDIRGMLAFENSLIHDQKAYHHALASVSSYGQMTIWLEYVAEATLEACNALATQAEAIQKHTGSVFPAPPLNDRQKQILILLDVHGAKVTNREVQKRFRISQITASRDLARLVSLGLLVSFGKGRGISYSLA